LTIPRLRLPKRVVLVLRKTNGKRSMQLRAVCVAVERVVTRATGRDATGATHALQGRIYAGAKRGETITFKPRLTGRLIAAGLARERSTARISATLVSSFRAGHLTR
jgi:hypothetical protein